MIGFSRWGVLKCGAKKDLIKSMFFKGVDQEQYFMAIKPEDMVGRTFLSDSMDNDERHRERIVKAFEDH